MRLYKMKYKAKEEWALEDMKKEQIEASKRIVNPIFGLKSENMKFLRNGKHAWCLVHLFF